MNGHQRTRQERGGLLKAVSLVESSEFGYGFREVLLCDLEQVIKTLGMPAPSCADRGW